MGDKTAKANANVHEKHNSNQIYDELNAGSRTHGIVMTHL